MLSKTYSLGIVGVDAIVVEVEVDLMKGLPGFSIIGLPDSVIKESKDRIRSAIENSGFEFPPRNFIVNLAPAGFKKQGANFDLSIALAILHSTNQTEFNPAAIPMAGELSLTGEVRPVRGAIAMAITLYRNGFKKLIVPYENRNEACAVSEIEIYPVKTLEDVIAVFEGRIPVYTPDRSSDWDDPVPDNYPDFSEVCGQESVKRAVEIAAAGHHNLLMYGPPGAGKSMIAKCIPGILPRLSRDKSIETTMVHSIGGKLNYGDGLISLPPFRTPHHTASDIALVGGGKIPGVGEITLAHNGVLFMDEFIEFKNNVLQALRQPLEDNFITVSRAAGTVSFPADFMLVASSNPCQCGFLFDEDVECKCTPMQIKKYFSKIAGPILDRFDIEVYVPRVAYRQLMGKIESEKSLHIKRRVEKAREIQLSRFGENGPEVNSRMSSAMVKKYCYVDEHDSSFLSNAMKRMNLSPRSFFRILKVSRTIADIEGEREVQKSHILEALSYKSLNRYYDV
ncbi:MAG: YifB family Mg chelatase-like AAA ATPase [Spirochaetes bacterium]|nr:YifB family Mg chelatase-like AAA ATPase [Spirochaetota bacterium]